MAEILQQGKDIWTRMPLKGKIATIAAAVSTLGLILALVYYGSQGEYGVLFSDLKPEDAQRIVEKLKADNIPYSISNGGTTIQVPNDKISELRLQMASSGVISGGHVGFDLFDKTNFGATDFAQQVNYRRAIEGEIARTLEGMDEVDSARVHITPKRESVFTEKEEGAKASIMLRVIQGKALSSERTDAIVSLVASAIQGLDPADVSVVDTRGRLLTPTGHGKNGMSDAGTFNAQLDAKRKFELETAARVVALLEPVAGDGKIRADVSADVDFSQVEQTEEKYNPQSQVIRSQRTAEEKSKSSITTNPNRVAGTRANDPTTPVPPNQKDTKEGNDERVATTTNYEIDKTTRKTIGGGGRVNRLNVSVVVDYKNADGTSVARTADELKKFEELVTAAVGANEERGDSVVVQTMAFENSGLDAETVAASWMDKNKQLISTGIKYGTLVLIAILIFLFVIRPAKKSIKAAIAPADDKKALSEGETPSSEGEENKESSDDGKRIEDQKNDKALPEVTNPMTVAELEAQMDENGNEIDAENTELEEALVENPSVKQIENVRHMIMQKDSEESEIVVGTLRSWLHE